MKKRTKSRLLYFTKVFVVFFVSLLLFILEGLIFDQKNIHRPYTWDETKSHMFINVVGAAVVSIFFAVKFTRNQSAKDEDDF